MTQPTSPSTASTSGQKVLTAVAWAWVGLPFLYGVYSLLIKVPALF